MKKIETTFIEGPDVYVCNDCGAFSKNKHQIKHHDTCVPGECEKWGKTPCLEEDGDE